MKKTHLGVSLLCLIIASTAAFANQCTDNLRNYVSADGTVLSVSNCGLNDKLLEDKVIPFLNANPSIIWLYMPYNTVDGAGLQSLVQNNTTITKLDVSFNNNAGHGAAALAGKQNLTELAMWGDTIGPVEAIALAGSKSLQILDLGENTVGAEGVDALAANTNLQFLGLSENKLNNAAIMSLSKNQTLQNLDVSDNALGPVDAAKLNTMSSLTYLDVSNNQLGDKGAENFAKNTNLTTLFIANNLISNAGAEAISTISNLTKLDISTNPIHAKGLSFLASHLLNLQLLDAHEDQITTAAELAKMPLLSDLNLDGNYLDVETGVKLAKDTTITNLYLAKTDLTDESAKVFATNNTLWALDVSYNPRLSAAAIAAMQNNPNFSLPNHWLWTTGDKAISKRHVLPAIAEQQAKCSNQQTTFCKNLTTVVQPKNQSVQQ